MKEMTDTRLEESSYLLFIHTPLCGTCRLARAMLEKIESIHEETVFYEMNASLFPQFMQDRKVESVPCLLIKQNGIIEEKVYAFRSIANIYSYLLKYRPDMFVH